MSNIIDNLRAANNDDDRIAIINNNASNLSDNDLDPVAGGATAKAIATKAKIKAVRTFNANAQKSFTTTTD